MVKEFMIAEIITATKIVLNNGAADGVKLGDTFLIYALGKPIKDPASGEILEPLEIIRGRGRVVHLQEKIATLESIDTHSVPKRRLKQSSSIFGIPTEVEIVSEFEITPFNEVQIGDKARKISS